MTLSKKHAEGEIWQDILFQLARLRSGATILPWIYSAKYDRLPDDNSVLYLRDIALPSGMKILSDHEYSPENRYFTSKLKQCFHKQQREWRGHVIHVKKKRYANKVLFKIQVFYCGVLM